MPVPGGAGEEVVPVVLWTIVKAIVAVAVNFAFGRLVLRPVFRVIAVGQTPEIFATMPLMILLGTSCAMASLGLSLSIGGFIAGLLLGKTEYSMQVAAEIAPFRGLLLGLFFMTVGLNLDPPLIVREAGLVAGLVVSLILGKAGLLAMMVKLSGQPWGASIRLGLLLSQGGEFAFIVFDLAARESLMPVEVVDLLVGVVAISMALMPLLARHGVMFEEHMDDHETALAEESESTISDMQNHVIIVGFGRVGQSIAKMLTAADIPYVAVEFEPTRVSEAWGQGCRFFTAMRAGWKCSGRLARNGRGRPW